MPSHRIRRSIAALGLLAGFSAASAQAATYEPGQGAVPFYAFENEALNDRMGMRVNIASGNLLLTSSDVAITGTGLDLLVERSYNSLSAAQGYFSPGWRMNFGQDVKVTQRADGNVEFRAPSDFTAVFTRQADGSYKAPLGLHAALAKGADGVFTLTYNQSRVKLRFDAAGTSLGSIIDKNNNVVDATSDAAGKVLDVLDTQGRRTTFQYDTSNRLISTTDSTARMTRYAYDTAGNLTTYTDAGGKITRYAYNAARRLTEITDPRGNKTKIAYDASHRVTSYTRVTDITNGTGPTTRFAYATGDARCPAATTSTAVTDANGNVTTYCWDSERRVKKVLDALGRARDTTYDVDANVTELANGSSVSKATWVEGGRIESVTSPTGGKSSFAYGDATHRFFPTSYTNPQGRSTAFVWQSNNLTRITDGDQKQTSFTYNANGTLSSSTSPKGAGQAEPNPYKTTYQYDAQGNLTRIVHPAPLGAESFTYDALSRVATRTDGKGQRQTYFYDALDRVTCIEYRNASGVIEHSVTYNYDGNGNRISRGGATGTTTYSYDALNRLKTEGIPFPSGITQTYNYDATGNLTSYGDAGGTTNYAYDKVNNLTRLTEANAAVTTFGYDTRNNRTSTAYPNGVTITRAFDLSNRVTSITARLGTAAPIMDRSYSYDPDGAGPQTDSGLRFKEIDRVANTTTDYTYDALDRLREAHTVTTGTTTTRNRWTYTYDANSNRTSQVYNGATTSYAYNAANQLCWRVAGTSSAACGSPPAGAITYIYDANGNETSNTSGRTLGYNAKNQQTSSRAPGQSFTETFTYAGADHWERVRAVGHPDDSFSYTNSPLGVMSLVGDGGYTARYTRDDDGGLVAMNVASGARRYYIADAHGSIVATTNASGAVDASYSYDPFGATLSFTGSRQPWGFAGQYQDTNGFYKMGMRWYDTTTGRWTQQDPLQKPQATRAANRYLYAGADPVNVADPMGLHFLDVVESGVEGAIGGAAVGFLTGGPAGAASGAAAGAASGLITGALKEYGNEDIRKGVELYETYGSAKSIYKIYRSPRARRLISDA